MIPALVADATTHNGIGRRAQARVCGCGAIILVGLDADRCAGEARVDPTPLTAVGEALAIMTGRSTYLLRTVGRPELDHRSRWHIGGASADDVAVLAEHACGTPPLPTRTMPTPHRREDSTDDLPY